MTAATRGTLLRGGVLVGPGVRDGVTCLLVRGGRIAWTGSDLDADQLVGDDVEIVELRGSLVTPGFVDAHVHVTETGLAGTGIDVATSTSAGSLLEAVAAAAATAPAGLPLLGHGWDETTWADPRLPTSDELDRASAGREVYLSRIDVHSALVSSRLARRCGAAALPGWDGAGRVERDAHHAARRATRELTPDHRRALQVACLTAAARAGIVLVHEMAAPDISGAADLVELLALAGPASARPDLPTVVAMWAHDVTTQSQAAQWQATFGPGLLGLGGDLNMDGSFGSRTAALRGDYADAPGVRGHRYRQARQVADHVEAVTLAGMRASFHAIGDDAVAEALAGYREAARRLGEPAVADAGHRLEHVESPDAEAVATMARLRLTASVQPAFDAAWAGPGGMYERRLGRARTDLTNPFATFASAGVTMAFGSDSPVTPLAPWAGVQAALRPHVREHAISAHAALEAHTVAGWLAAGVDAGRLVTGAPAHLAVWTACGADPLGDLAEGAEAPACLATMREGTWVWRAPGW